MQQTIKISQARDQLNTIVNQVFRKETRVLVEKSGIPVAAIVSTDDLKELQRMEEKRKEEFKLLEDMRKAFADVPEERLEKETAKAVERARAEARKAQATRETA